MNTERPPQIAPKLSLPRKLGYAFGDYGCNLYWQSLSFFLLFFYTDVVGIPVATAGLIYMVASIFDGCIDPLVGAALDRHATRSGRYRPWLLIGALPLAGAFMLLYWQPPTEGTALVLVIAAVHLAFRVCYTLVAVPLASLSASMTNDSRERTTLAALRMLFGAAATVTIGFATQPLATLLGAGDQARGMFGAAAMIGGVATIAFLIAFASTYENPVGSEPTRPPRLGTPRLPFSDNRAFATLALGLFCATISTTALNKTLLYYFKYVVHDEGAARWALSSAALIALVLAPGWAVLGRRIGKRRMWLTAVALGLSGLAVFAIARPTSAIGASAFFMWMQIVTVGVQVGYWGTLPDTVEYGQWQSGVRRESVLFGIFMFVQKLGLGVSAALFGWCLSVIGYAPGAAMNADVGSKIGLVMAGLSALGLAGSGIATWLSPLRLGVHERIVADLVATRGAALRVADVPPR